jgi:multiple sugar transport system substrate-binding protein
MKKSILWFLVLIICISMMAVFSLSSCKKEAAKEAAAEEPAVSEEEPETGETAKAETVKIAVPKVLGWVTTDALLPAVSERLAEKNIEVVPIESDNMTLRDKQMMDAASGTADFDVYIAWEALMPLMNEYVEPLDDYLAEAGVSFDNYYDSVVEQISYGGNICWVPIHVNCQIGYARTDLFSDPEEQANFKAEYGYDLPAPDENGVVDFETKDQFIDVAKFFTRAENDMWGYAPAGKWDHGCCVFEEILLRSGLEYFDAEGHSLWGPAHPENQAAVEDVVKWMQDLVLVHKVVSPGTTGMEMTEVNQMFKEGKAAMSFTWNVDFWGENTKPEVMAAWNNTKPSSWAIDFVNTSPDNKGLMSIWCYALNKNSKNKEAAIEFLLAVSDPELRKEVHSTVGLPCGNGDAGLTDWLVENNYAPGAIVDSIKSVGSLWPISKTPFEETDSVRDVCRENMEKVLSGTLTPSDFVKVTGERIEAIMQEAGYF